MGAEELTYQLSIEEQGKLLGYIDALKSTAYDRKALLAESWLYLEAVRKEFAAHGREDVHLLKLIASIKREIEP